MIAILPELISACVPLQHDFPSDTLKLIDGGCVNWLVRGSLAPLLACLTSLAAACAGKADVEIRSAKSSAPTHPLPEIFVLARVGLFQSFGPKTFAARFTELSERCRLKAFVEAERIGEGDVDKALDRLIAVGATNVLTVVLRGFYGANNELREEVYEVRLFDSKSERVVWSAMASIGAGEERARALTRAVLKRLSDDGVIQPSCAKVLGDER